MNDIIGLLVAFGASLAMVFVIAVIISELTRAYNNWKWRASLKKKNRIEKWYQGLSPRNRFRVWFYGTCYISIIVGCGFVLLIGMIIGMG